MSGRHCRKQRGSYRTNFLTQIPPNHFVQSAFIERLDFLKEWLGAWKTDILGGEMTLVKKPKNREDVRKSLFCIHNALHSPIVVRIKFFISKSSEIHFLESLPTILAAAVCIIKSLSINYLQLIISRGGTMDRKRPNWMNTTPWKKRSLFHVKNLTIWCKN